MTEFSELLGWASAEGLILNGIQPAWINGCGKGIVACRELKVCESLLLDNPHKLTEKKQGRRSYFNSTYSGHSKYHDSLPRSY